MRLKWFGLTALALTGAVATPAQTWRQVGPPGGTVISLGADPRDASRLYLGTSDGHVFTSSDEGAHWQLLSRIGTGQDDVITHIIVDSRRSEEHTSELQSHSDLVCRLLLEQKNICKL